MDYRVISADSHVDLGFLPWDLFTSQAPDSLKERMPRVVRKDGRDQWWANGTYLEDVGHYGDTSDYSPELKERVSRMAKLGFVDDSAKGAHHPTNAELRLNDQELDGIDAEVIYGLFAVATKLKDTQQITTIYRIYNDWMANFTNRHPNRLAGLACLPSHDPQEAVTELRRAASLGLRGAEFGASISVKPIYYRDWDVLWQASAECNMPISFHTTGIALRKPAPEDESQYNKLSFAIEITCFQLSGAEVLSSIILSGACERFPGFKFVLGECGVTWIPYVLDRMDHESEGSSDLRLKPSEYWQRQGYSTFQKEAFAGDFIDFIGVDNVMWGSDYPHPDGIWPDSQETIANNLKSLKSQTKRKKIICDNARELYGFK